MKLSEFQEKLTTVSETKLRAMLADSRRKGPDVAVKLILAEAERRGVDLNAAGSGEPAPAGSAGTGVDEASGEQSPEGGASGEGVPVGAGKGAWLAEEANQGLPMIIKILITVAVLGGILAGLFMLLGKH